MNEFQEKELEVFQEVEKVLTRHGLRYFAIGGTCIGAIRHHGFIPWDDDIDIAMPRKDYEAFRTAYYKELPSYYRKLDWETSPNIDILFTKIFDSRTTFVEKTYEKFPDCYTGVFIDIMPIDGLPEDEEARNTLVDRCAKWNLLNYILKRRTDKVNSFNRLCKESVKNLITFCVSLLPDGKSRYIKKIERSLAPYDFDSSSKVYFTWRGKKTSYEVVFDQTAFASAIDVPFENTTMRVPVDYDAYLTADFGDYMRLPPEEKRQGGHETCFCDLKKPVSYYAERKKRGEI